jgi:hypothetical protein
MRAGVGCVRMCANTSYTHTEICAVQRHVNTHEHMRAHAHNSHIKRYPQRIHARAHNCPKSDTQSIHAHACKVRFARNPAWTHHSYFLYQVRRSTRSTGTAQPRMPSLQKQRSATPAPKVGNGFKAKQMNGAFQTPTAWLRQRTEGTKRHSARHSKSILYHGDENNQYS